MSDELAGMPPPGAPGPTNDDRRAPGYVSPGYVPPGYVPPPEQSSYGQPSYGQPAPGQPPYGQQSWAPQHQLFEAYRPGIIRLQPLGLGDVLDGAVRAVRFNPKSMIGLSLLVLAIFLVPSALLTAGFLRLASDQRLADGVATVFGLGGTLLTAVFAQLATVTLTGLLIHVVGDAVLGRKAGLADTWRATRGRLLPLIGLNLLVALVMLVPAALMLTPGILLIANDNVWFGVGLLVLAGLGLLALGVALWVKTSLAGPALVLERAGIVASLRRSFELTRGAFWRLFGIMLLASIIAGVVGWLLELPFGIAQVVMLGVVGLDTDSSLLALTFIDHFASLLSGAVTTPFVAAVVGLLYIDRRIRLEALDVVLVRTAQQRSGAGTAGPRDSP